MKLLIYSDLHLEFAKFRPDPAAVAAADVVVLAGDIAEGMRGTRWAAKTFSKPVVYVAGNHEFYGHDWDLMRFQLRVDCKGSHVHFLDDDQVVIDGVRFLGCTLWTDFDLMIDEGLSREQAMRAARYRLNDSFSILNAGKRFEPETSRDAHKASRRWLGKRLAEPHDGPTVVVTHHAPCALSVPAHYVGNVASPAYASELDPARFFAGKAAVWIHGHMHASFDYVRHGTRIVCNPQGYRKKLLGTDFGPENPDFDPKKIVEVGYVDGS